MTTNIYILQLAKGKYYVGKTDNLERRAEEHFNGTASTWTRIYKPIGIEKIISGASPFDEDRYTKEYMSLHGIENVRGGSYVSEVLSDSQMEALQLELRNAKDQCTNCGKKGHFIKDCHVKVVGSSRCFRCGRTGHYMGSCYAHTHANGYALDDSDNDEDSEDDDDDDDEEEDYDSDSS